MFFQSKRHNSVRVSIMYTNVNDRSAFEAELNLVQELTTLMVSCSNIHEWGCDPVVRPVTYLRNPDVYEGSINLKFPINTRIIGSDGELKCYSYAGLYAVLAEISKICKKYAAEFQHFTTALDLDAMKAPWVIPVDGQGVILREGSRQIDYAGTLLPRSAIIGAQEMEIEQLLVVGEHRAVDSFDRMWRRWATTYQDTMERKYPTHPHICRGPTLNLSAMKDANPNLPWQNVGVFALFKDAIGYLHWEQLGDMHNAMTRDYVLAMGNHMLNTPLEYANTDKLIGNNIFLNDHAYYSFECVI